MQNVEYKCELRDPELVRGVCARTGATHVGTVRQLDTYFRIPDGRLKKRETEGELGMKSMACPYRRYQSLVYTLARGKGLMGAAPK